MGGLPEAHIASMQPTELVDVPGTSTPAAGIALRLGPNPTHGRVRIAYTLPVTGRVRIAVYDVRGRRVAIVTDEAQTGGVHEAEWEGATGARAVAPGLYFVKIEAGERSAMRRCVIVR